MTTCDATGKPRFLVSRERTSYDLHCQCRQSVARIVYHEKLEPESVRRDFFSLLILGVLFDEVLAESSILVVAEHAESSCSPCCEVKDEVAEQQIADCGSDENC